MTKEHDIILTGGTGMLGRHVHSYLSAIQGLNVRIASRSAGTDLTDERQVTRFFKQHQSKYLINLFGMNAPVTKQARRGSDMFEISMDSFRAMMETNVTALFNVCRTWYQESKDIAKGIVNFSSIYGTVASDPWLYQGVPDKHPAYGPSKAAVISLSKYLAQRLAPVRVNTIVLGGVYTKEMPEDFVTKYKEKTALKRMATPKDIFGAVMLLCDCHSKHITGSTITIDGGYTAK